MAKQKSIYSCSECGVQHSKWAGQCSDCGGWNVLVETLSVATSTAKNSRFAGFAGATAAVVQRLAEVVPDDVSRAATGQLELDRVLGGGLVPGSVILIGGDPGVGKSTLLLQTMALLSARWSTLYVTGEESLQQVSLRAHRLNLDADQVRLLAETNIETILAHAVKEKPQVMVIDSIQTAYSEQLQSAPGSVAQVRESAAQLVRFAKQSATTLFLVGHVTKEGTLAGPRVLEHMVDTVLYFEGDTSSQFRIVRAIKNRFGAVNELGVFAMTEKGLREVSNPSAIFLSRHQEQVPGSAIMVTREGSRPLLVEVQALVAESHLGNPRRVTVGLDQNRLAMLLAVLQRHGSVTTHDQDVFINVVGGVRVMEPAADLPLLLSVISSLRDRPLPSGLVVFGEIGLAGEVRPVQGGQERLREAVKHGFKRAIMPKANVPKQLPKGIEVTAVERLVDALEQF